jgi:tRNA-uridine 2-sulfurtransferase
VSKGKAFSLLSGGLDSLLATRLIMDQGIEVEGLHFITPFFGYEKKGREVDFIAKCRDFYGIHARVIDVSEEYFSIVRNPRHGYGKNFNPCIDCKIFLFAKAKCILREEKADFLITGEVLGQRPMSQRRDTLRVVERDSGTDDILLRPLSAKNLKATLPERTGLVDREKLLNLSGRSRKPQIKLADDMGFQGYPAPAGGCLLTDPILADRIRKFFSQNPHIGVEDILLLLVGRHFQLSENLRLVIGREEKENQKLLDLFRKGDFLLKIQTIPGPLGLLRGKPENGDIELAASILTRYSKARDQERVPIQYGQEIENLPHQILVTPLKEDKILSLKR